MILHGCDKTVTIVHLEYDGEADEDKRTETVLHGCSWYSNVKASVSNSGLDAACLYKCRIPLEAAGEAEPPMARGNKIRCGQDEGTILAIHDNRSRPAPHWYIEAG